MASETMNTQLWKPRSVAETLQVYADWAKDYDADVLASGYATPTRAATALAEFVAPDAPILDFGCGTGLSGKALRAAGLTTFDGTDISTEMLALAQGQNLYRRIWQSNPGVLDVIAGAYTAILACGVVSLGAAPPETLDLLIDKLGRGGHLAFSYNDPTLADPAFTGHLARLIANGGVNEIYRAHGPHLPQKGMGSDVIILRKT
jgi:predicted TPR repeat methyltransferase